MAGQRNGNATTGARTINLDNFSTRLKMLYSHWHHYSLALWGSADVLTIATPLPSDNFRYLKSSALTIWLFGCKFPDTIMVFMKKQIHFLCSHKNAFLLEDVKQSAKEALGVEVVMHVKTKKNDGASLVDGIFRAVRAQARFKEPILGHIGPERVPIWGRTERKRAPEGNLLKIWADKFKDGNCLFTDISGGLSDLFEVKDDAEILNLKKAAYLTSTVMNYFVVPKLVTVIYKREKVSHSSLRDETEEVIVDPAKVNVKLKAAERVEVCYPPIFQSGGEFDFKPSALSNDENLCYDSNGVILCSIGARYNSYCSNVARTFLVDANSKEREAYKVLVKAQEAAISALRDGNRAKAAYQAALSLVKEDAPELAGYLTRSAGTGIGLEFRESGICLNGWSDRVLKAGMVFNVLLGFHYLKTGTTNPRTQKVSMLIADTVIVGQNYPEVVTSKCSKDFKDVAFPVYEDEDEDEYEYCSEEYEDQDDDDYGEDYKYDEEDESDEDEVEDDEYEDDEFEDRDIEEEEDDWQIINV